MEHKIFEWLSWGGPPVLFAAQMFGIFGVPIPDELLLTIAGALVRRGVMSAPLTFAAAVAGCATGITLSYVLGRTVGIAALHRALRLHPTALHRAERWYQRFGAWILAFGYFVPGVRHVSAIAAGSVPLSYHRFARAAYPGGVLWCSTFLTVGYLGGNHWEQLTGFLLTRLPFVGAAIGIMAVLALIVASRRRRRSWSS